MIETFFLMIFGELWFLFEASKLGKEFKNEIRTHDSQWTWFSVYKKPVDTQTHFVGWNIL